MAGPGFITPARIFLACCLTAAASPLAAQPPAPAPATSPAPAPAANQPGVPDSIVVNKLIWSAMAAVDHANRTGNYSVLRDLGAPSFQASNSAASLAGVFQALKDQQLDLGYTLVVAPNLQFPPAIAPNGLLRLRGAFPLRPAAIAFDLLFENIAGQWRIFGIAVAPIVPGRAQSGSTTR
ncbi:MAG TPA: hypothetical protein VF548_09030 [Allosphingosinicella sp.]|jgi:hypothetical protein